MTLPNGRTINYGEVENDKPALLLIHGQMSVWEDYALVMPDLSKMKSMKIVRRKVDLSSVS